MTGVERLSGATHRIDGDFVDAGSWAVAAAVTGGEVEVRGARAVDIEPIVAVLSRFGVRSDLDDARLRVRESTLEGAGRVTTGVWPGFPSDMVSLVTVLATQARGSTLIHDWLYELRLFALEQLSGMGADLFLCDPHRIVVTGPRRLRRRILDSRDIRSGMALVVAALCAPRARAGSSPWRRSSGATRASSSGCEAWEPPSLARPEPPPQAQSRPRMSPTHGRGEGLEPHRLLRPQDAGQPALQGREELPLPPLQQPLLRGELEHDRRVRQAPAERLPELLPALGEHLPRRVQLAALVP